MATFDYKYKCHWCGKFVSEPESYYRRLKGFLRVYCNRTCAEHKAQSGERR